MTRRVGILGGTFDPIHCGHVAAGRAAERALDLDEIRLVPSHVPPHRAAPVASTYHRFAMAALVALDEPTWTVLDAELAREGPSYTYDTLVALHESGLRASQIFFITGADAFAEVATWSRYPAVLDLAHFVVVARPGTARATLEARVPALVPRITEAGALSAGSTTHIVFVDAHTPDVSSTDIRRRVASAQPLDGLVTPVVAQHIRRHGLYRTTHDR